MNSKDCHIVLACDSHYLVPAFVLMESILEHLDSRVYPHFWLIGDELDLEQMHTYDERLSREHELHHLPITLLPHDLPTSTVHFMQRVTRITLARLFIDTLLPKDIPRVVYLDSDILAVGDIAPMFTLPLNGKSIGAVQDPDCMTFGSHKGIPGVEAYPQATPDLPYFNAGVLVIDRNVWREHKIGERTYDYIIKESARLRYTDQDALNLVCLGDWQDIPPEYNMMTPGDWDTMHAIHRSKFSLVHFVGHNKVWAPLYAETTLASKYRAYKQHITTPR
jgi:lipopolysaccharide biosynthesis glycosyltransferase